MLWWILSVEIDESDSYINWEYVLFNKNNNNYHQLKYRNSYCEGDTHEYVMVLHGSSIEKSYNWCMKKRCCKIILGCY